MYIRGYWGRTRDRLSEWLKEGITVERLALSLALGFVLGICPLFGIPTLLGGLAAVVLRVNFPALQLVNYLVYPLQIILLLPFARLGRTLFGAASGFWGMAAHATAAWACFALPAGLVAYFVVRQALVRHRARQSEQAA